MVKKMIAAGVAISLLVLLTSPNWAAELEIAHWWTSKGEARAVAVIRDAFLRTGNQWRDTSLEGGGGHKLIPLLRGRVAAGNPPSAMQIYMGPILWRFAEEGFLLQLDKVAKKENWQRVLPGIINRMIQYRGHYVAVPVNVHRVNYMWINPAVFRNAHARIPETWEDFFVAAEKISQHHMTPLALGEEPWQILTLFENLVLGKGGVEFHKRALIQCRSEALQSQMMMTVFKLLRRIKSYVDKDAPGRSWDQTTQRVIDGKAGMQIMGDWAKGEFISVGLNAQKDFICHPVPGTAGIFLIDTDTFAMFDTKQEEIESAQKQLAKTIISPNVQKGFNRIKGAIPARLDISPKDLDACACQSMKDFQAASQKNLIVPSFAFFQANTPEVTEIVMALVNTFYHSNMSPKEAVTKLRAAVFSAL